MDAVRKLDYHRNIHARRLATGQSNLFGLVISDIENPFFGQVIRGFQAEAWSRGFDILLCNTDYDLQQTDAVMRKLIESGVRGAAVMTSSIAKSITSELTASGIGLVFCNLGPPETLVANIVIDYQLGIKGAIEHLVGLGHRRAAVIAGPLENRTAVAIQSALVVGLKGVGLTPSLVMNSDYRVDAGASAVGSILAHRDRPTVIFCGSDLIAMGAMNALEESGVKVPEDISVVGVNDISFAFLARPPLTTIRVPRHKLGAIAFHALDRMMNMKRKKGAEYYVETELVVRRSTAPATDGHGYVTPINNP